jgi:hypothetical protein
LPQILWSTPPIRLSMPGAALPSHGASLDDMSAAIHARARTSHLPARLEGRNEANPGCFDDRCGTVRRHGALGVTEVGGQIGVANTSATQREKSWPGQ